MCTSIKCWQVGPTDFLSGELMDFHGTEEEAVALAALPVACELTAH